jgi:hypothetical protein
MDHKKGGIMGLVFRETQEYKGQRQATNLYLLRDKLVWLPNQVWGTDIQDKGALYTWSVLSTYTTVGNFVSASNCLADIEHLGCDVLHIGA